MAGGQTCALAGCNKPPWPSVACITPHLTCGNLHHQLLMASRFNPALPPPYQAILTRNADGQCALLSCEKPPYAGHSWCSRSHYLLWLTEFTSSLQPDQICKLPGCTRHVFVDDNAAPSQFCGWQHHQKFVMQRALNQCHRRQEPRPAHPQEPPLPAPSNESECRLVPSIKSLMHSLEKFALFGILPKNVRVLDDFYEKHPWEVFTEGHACLLIARLKFASKGRKLTTKGHYHWKQSGPGTKKSKYTGKYYTYMKRKGKEKEGDEQNAEGLYTMKEYTMEGVKWYSLVELVKEKPSSHGKLRKEQPCKQQSVGACSSQDTITSKYLWNDDNSEDSIFRGLSPLNCPQICTVDGQGF